jgi:hypothetical protein
MRGKPSFLTSNLRRCYWDFQLWALHLERNLKRVLYSARLGAMTI